MASADTNPTKLPDIEPIQTGKIDTATTRCFDLFCVGKYEQGSDLKLNIQPAKKIPNLVTKNASGDLIFAESAPMCTIRAPKGHNVWVNVELKTITTEASKYMCLGIKKRGEEDYYDILCTGNLSRYVDVLETDTVELVPLVSSTELPTYTPVKVGETAKIADDINTYDFGSVYRVCTSLYEGQWIELPSDLEKISGDYWPNNGHYGVGIINQKLQLLAICLDGRSAFSIDGVHWKAMGSVYDSNNDTICSAGATYGNGIWCAVNKVSGEVKVSIDGAKNWGVSSSKVATDTHAIIFGNDVFVAFSNNGDVYTSRDGEKWIKITVVSAKNGRILGYGGGKWICGDENGNIFHSINGENWASVGFSNIASTCAGAHGGVYANGYFYVVGFNDGYVAKSSDGANWERVFKIPHNTNHHYNVTYYKNKLYIFGDRGSYCHIGLFRPDGTVDEL